MARRHQLPQLALTVLFIPAAAKGQVAGNHFSHGGQGNTYRFVYIQSIAKGKVAGGVPVKRLDGQSGDVVLLKPLEKHFSSCRCRF